MAKYRAAMTAFGLATGDVFESDDPRWADQVKAGTVVLVDDDTQVTVEGDEDDEDSDG